MLVETLVARNLIDFTETVNILRNSRNRRAEIQDIVHEKQKTPAKSI